MRLAREPVAVVTLMTALASASVPIMLVSGVSTRVVEVVSAVIGGYSAAAVAYLRSVVTPSSQVALTHDDLVTLNASNTPPAAMIVPLEPSPPPHAV